MESPITNTQRKLEEISLTSPPPPLNPSPTIIRRRQRLGHGQPCKRISTTARPIESLPVHYQQYSLLTPKKNKSPFSFITQINDQAAGTISKIFGRTHSEIDHQRANAILCDITREPHITTAAAPRKLVIGTSKLPEHGASKSVVNQNSAAISSTDVQLPSSHIDVSQNKTLLSYAGIPICQQDLLCLADEQFLNDSIIDFWLRYFQIEILSTVDKEKTYMFSTFFYKGLTTKPKKRPSISNNTPEEDSNLTPAEKRHNRVKRWTKNVDIFEKDFLIIPICENLHWFLAVICFPGLIGVHDITTGEPLPEYKLKKKVSTKSNKTGINTETASATNGFIDDILGASQLQNDSSVLMNESSSNAVDVKVKQPCILVFDSLVGETRSRVYSTLREYLKMEYKTRKLKQPVAEGASQQPVIVEREFTKTSMPASMPSVPQQPNHCDCGIYTLFYVECFFKYRIQTFDMSSEACKHWTNLTCDSKREEIYMCIQALVKKMNPEAVPLIPQCRFQ